MTQLSAGKPLTINSITLIPIEETSLYSGSVKNSEFIYASKKPMALVVLSGESPKAYNMSFTEVSIEQLIEKTKGLKELMNNI